MRCIYIYLPYITHYSSFRFLFHYPEYSGRPGLSFEGSGFGFRSFGVFSGHVCVNTHRLYSAGARVLVHKPSSVNPKITGLAGMLYDCMAWQPKLQLQVTCFRT